MFESVDEFYRRFYFRPRKMFSPLGGIIGDRQVKKRLKPHPAKEI
ncbi:MAG: hypothetical protein WAL67_13730 [Candidatus Cybelea sp.]